jgi:hypothetical protein
MTQWRPDGPGRIAPGQRVTCLPGALPAREGGQGGGVLVTIGPKTSMVDVYGGRRRRIPNELLHPQAGPHVAAERDARGLRTANADGRGWLPGWSWLGWTVAQHIEYQQGVRRLPTPSPAPQRLIIVACGARKANCFEAPAGQMYIGSYHRAARRAADAISAPGTRVMILSARYGLLDPADRILRYETRLGSRWAITAQGLQEQAEQLGVRDTAEVVVLAPAAYADLAAHVWPHAQLALAGTRGIGDQMARFAALATGRVTIADLLRSSPGADALEAAPPTTGGRHAVSVRGGRVHLVETAARPVWLPGSRVRSGRSERVPVAADHGRGHLHPLRRDRAPPPRLVALVCPSGSPRTHRGTYGTGSPSVRRCRASGRNRAGVATPGHPQRPARLITSRWPPARQRASPLRLQPLAAPTGPPIRLCSAHVDR